MLNETQAHKKRLEFLLDKATRGTYHKLHSEDVKLFNWMLEVIKRLEKTPLEPVDDLAGEGSSSPRAGREYQRLTVRPDQLPL